jgi:hypothetical protein
MRELAGPAFFLAGGAGPVVLLGSAVLARVCLVASGEDPAVLPSPCLYGRALPDLPHRQLVIGLGEVAPVDDLLYSLPAETAEHLGDLGSADKVSRSWCHVGIMTCHLTRPQPIRHTSHMTSIRDQITGPTDPESPWGGADVTLAKIRLGDVDRGMVLGCFGWNNVPGMPQTMRMCGVTAVDAVNMEPVFDRGVYRGQRIEVRCGEQLTVGSERDFVWQFAGLVTSKGV